MSDPTPSKPPARPSRSPGRDEPPKPFWRGWVIPGLLLASVWGWHAFGPRVDSQPSITYSRFYDLVEKEVVETVNIRGQEVTGKLRTPTTVGERELKTFRTMIPDGDDELMPTLRKKGVDVVVESEEQPLGVQLLMSILPFALLIGLWVWWSRRTQKMWGDGGPLGGMLKGRAKKFQRDKQVNVTFQDVAGLKAAKQDLQEIIGFLKDPERFKRLGGKVPHGVLLVGPPGTGKTLVARAVAGEAGVPFFSINGSEFIELFVGVGASRVRELFDEAKKASPSIIFIDEIDAVGRSRGAGLGGGHDEREQTLNQLLSEMDGFDRNDLTVIIAATNRPDVLDPALLRPGRFDRRVVVDRPELDARQAILEVHAQKKPLAPDVDLREVAKNTPGFSGADLANLLNEAALHATRIGGDAITKDDVQAAYDKVVLGDPRETKLDPQEKQRVAVHESGHAVVAHFTPDAEPLNRVTIIPRGMALGVTMQSPGNDKHIMTQPELNGRLNMLMGGYAAEKLLLGDTSSGAADDLKKATDIAFKMVAHYGMSDKVGPMFHEHRTEHPFLGQRLATESGTSDSTVHTIEEEARHILQAAVDSANRILSDNRQELEQLVDVLLDRETVEKDEFADILCPSASAGDGVPSTLHFDRE